MAAVITKTTESWAAVSLVLGIDRAAWAMTPAAASVPAATGASVAGHVSAVGYGPLADRVSVHAGSRRLGIAVPATGPVSLPLAAAGNAAAVQRNHGNVPFDGRKAAVTAGVQPRGIPV